MVDDQEVLQHRLQVDLLEAARIARSIPLLVTGEPAVGRTDPLHRGWFSGPEECAGVIAGLIEGTRRTGYAFGGPWPWLEVQGAALGPALPVPVTTTEWAAPDGLYRRSGGAIVREAGGRERVLLSESDEHESQRFDLLWFTDSARFMVRNGALEVEDLFSRIIVPAHQENIASWLVARHRHHPKILERLPVTKEVATKQTVEVARRVAVTATGWKDPLTFFRSGIGFTNVNTVADRLLARGPGRDRIELSISSREGGWKAQRLVGCFPFETLTVEQEGDNVVLSAVIAPTIDPLAESMRARLAFDLHSFLVSL